MATQIITINQLVKMFKDFSTGHKQLKDFGYGQISESGTGQDMSYPFMWITREGPSAIEYNRGNNQLIPSQNLSFLIMDQHNDQPNDNDDISKNGLSSDNGLEISSDMYQIGQDLLIYIKDYMTENGVDLDETSISFEELLHVTPDNISGWRVNLTVVLNNVNCTIPGINNIMSISNCPRATYINSDGSFTTNINSGQTFTSSDITFNVNGATFSTNPTNTDISLLVKDTDGVSAGSKVGNEWIVPAIVTPLNTGDIFKTGAFTLRTGDDGDEAFGRGVDFFTLDFNNPFGNTSRFTDILGTQVYTSNEVIDWSTYNQVNLTVLVYYRVVNSNATLLVQLAGQPYTRAGRTGWYIPNVKQMHNIQNYGVIRNYFNYSPFNFEYVGTTDRLWCSTSDSVTVGVFFLNTGQTVGGQGSSYKAFLTRTFTLTELGL